MTHITGVFVDDTSLAATSDYVSDPSLTGDQNQVEEIDQTVQKLDKLAQHWEWLLFSTGGCIYLQKSHCYLMTWLWKNGIPRLATTDQAPGELSLTAENSGTAEKVPRVEPTTGFHTLGVYIAPCGSQTKQVMILHQHSENHCNKIRIAHLTSEEAYISYISYLHPCLIYPLPCSPLTQQQCRTIQAPVLSALLSKMHLNCHTLRAILFAGQ